MLLEKKYSVYLKISCERSRKLEPGDVDPESQTK